MSQSGDGSSYAPVLNQRIRREMRRPNGSWRIDETYVKVAGNWAYLYRAVDSAGETIEFMLSPKRDLIAAKLFLRLASCGHVPSPRVINVSGAIRNDHEIVDLTQSSSVFVASDLCLLGYERTESLSLRHDAAGFHRYETSRDRRRHS